MLMVLSGLGLPVTGVANHIYGFSPLSIERHAWMSAHNALSVLFVVFSIWHVVLNRRAFWKHMTGAVSRMPSVSRELMIAGAIVATTLLLFVGHAFHAGH
jgi:Domain of unknown function (DUF4405)